MPYSIEERDFLVNCYQTSRSFKKCQSEFQVKFGRSTAPAKSSILRLVRKFKATGSVGNRKRPGRKSLATTKLLDISKRLQQSPGKSLRRVAAESGISFSTVRRIAQTISPHLYSVTVIPQLQLADMQKRMRYCKWLISFLTEKPGVLERTWFTDDAIFYIDGHIRSGHNLRLWTCNDDRKPELNDLTEDKQKVGMWCAMSANRIIGPFFFHEASLCIQSYINIFKDFVGSLSSFDINEGFCQQDQNKRYISEKSRELVQTYFEDRIIGQDIWPPKSPDLSPITSFLWPYLKNKVYQHCISSVTDLENSIRQEVMDISLETLQTVAGNVQNRAQLCLECEGDYFQHLL